MNAKLPSKSHPSFRLITHFRIWLFCSRVQMNLGDNFLSLSRATKVYKASKIWQEEWKGLEQRASGRKSQKWLSSEPESYWQVRVKTTGSRVRSTFWWPGSRGRSYFICKFVYQKTCSSQNKRVGEAPSAVASSALSWHFQIYRVHLFFKMNVEVALKFGSDSIPQKCKLEGWFETGLKPWRHKICCRLWKKSLTAGKPVADLQSNWFPKWKLIRSGQGNTSRIQTC